MNTRSLVDSSPAIESAQNDAQIHSMPRPCCPLCEMRGKQLYTSLSDSLFGVPGNWDLRRCSACSILWLDPQPTAEDTAKLYFRYHTHHSAKLTRVGRLRQATHQCVLARSGYAIDPPKEILPRLLSYVPSIARAAELGIMALAPSQVGSLLDVGCGNGAFMGQMRSFGWRVSGVDPDPSAVAKGRDRGLSIFQGGIADVPDNIHYDVITLSHVIEHTPDPVWLLRECRKRLHPQTGTLIMTTPNIESLGHRWFKSHWRGLEVPRHFNLFSPGALSACVARSGLCVRSIRTETRIARMVYPTSRYAKSGYQDIGERTRFNFTTMCAGYVFQLLEDVLSVFKEHLGEEIYCVCTAPAEDDGNRN